jgi:hypothetical protein
VHFIGVHVIGVHLTECASHRVCISQDMHLTGRASHRRACHGCASHRVCISQSVHLTECVSYRRAYHRRASHRVCISFTSLPCAQGMGGEDPYIDTKDVLEASDYGRLGRQAVGHPWSALRVVKSCRKDCLLAEDAQKGRRDRSREER